MTRSRSIRTATGRGSSDPASQPGLTGRSTSDRRRTSACELLAATGYEVHGVDISEKALELARARVPNAIFRVSSEAGRLDYEDEYFDHCCVLGVVEHIQDPHVVVGESYRVLRSGGAAIYTVPNSLSPYFWIGGTGQVLEVPRRRAEWKRMFEAQGSELHASREILGHPGGPHIQ